MKNPDSRFLYFVVIEENLTNWEIFSSAIFFC
jgi:hypothetical protein